MKPIAKIDFSANGIFYSKGDEVKVKTKEQLMKLNERGFIEPLSQKDIQNFGKEEKTTKYKSSFDRLKKEE